MAGSLNGLRGSAFPDGPSLIDAPPAPKVEAADQKVTDALNKRFGFDAL